MEVIARLQDRALCASITCITSRVGCRVVACYSGGMSCPGGSAPVRAPRCQCVPRCRLTGSSPAPVERMCRDPSHLPGPRALTTAHAGLDALP